jgi:hypothetical protein
MAHIPMLCAKRKLTGEIVTAYLASKVHGPFVCPDCRDEVILKTGRRTVNHFAHVNPLACRYRPGDNGAEVPVKPDGFIRIHEPDATGGKIVRAFFLELDRSNEVQDTLVAKAGCYRDFYRRGGFAVRNGATRDDFEKFPFRVLMVFKNAERRNNTAERLLQNNPPILTMVWLTTFADVTADPFGPIWIRPSEYRDVTKGTPFNVERPNQNFACRRNAEREAFIESRVVKKKLLEN